ncbi:phytoene desaturase family protein [Ktedonobacter racemifer]|uniref:Amine oxidase n=1 Tax=Ktedonobacter racemifer DSM 44963 TaxID=485913 RepID=D6U0V3_KTERA|nr:NAD(P)/FAD-dependent oxidoreductase [Ktedonobacter racemifer]EFH82443.1 amine oxidase [Ktedonobacter racemifer DSM 44963]
MATHPRTQPPVIIVGGGLSGLSAAAYLSRAGHAVTLFEKASTPGGRARTRERNGFFFNQGAHALRLHEAGERVLSELGVSYSGSQPQPSGFSVLADGKVHPLPARAASLLKVPFLAPAAKEELMRVFGRVKHLNAEELQGRSLQEWLEEQVQHPQVRQFLLASARTSTYTHAPDLLSAGLTLSLLNSQGVLYLDGGWQTLVDGLRQKAQEAGARLITQARVKAIEVAGEKYRVRLEDDSRHEASAVLLATDPETASALVADGTHEALSRWAAQAIPAYVACLDIALRRLPRAENLVTYGMDRPLYYSVHSASAHLAPEGSALVHLMKYLRPGEAAEPEATQQELEGLIDLLQPGWRAEVVEQFFLPHMIASNAIVQARFGGLSGRPGPVVPGLPNLYIAGDWVGPEGEKADASFASARSAARLIIAQRSSRQSASLVSSSDVID